MTAKPELADAISDDVFSTLYGTTNEEELREKSFGSVIQLGLNFALDDGDVFTVAIALPLLPIICDKQDFGWLVDRIAERVSTETGSACHKASMDELEAYVKKERDAQMLAMLDKLPASSMGQA